MNLHEFSSQLYTTHISTLIRETDGLVATTQSLHILAIAVLVGSVLVTDLRLAGVLATDEAPQTVVRRHLPWLWSAVVVLLLTGSVLVIGEPNRVLSNPLFWTKLALIAFALVLTLLFRRPLLRPQFRLEDAAWAAWAKPMAWVSMLAWVAVISCGRWIAYAI